MLAKIGIAYLVVALCLFLFCIIFGKTLKRISLGKGIELGMLNSLLLSVLWPITILCSIVGMCYDAIQMWKKI